MLKNNNISQQLIIKVNSYIIEINYGIQIIKCINYSYINKCLKNKFNKSINLKGFIQLITWNINS